MLSELMSTLRSIEGPVTAAELGERLDVQPSALEPMLELLASRGLLSRDEGSTGATCTSGCGTKCSPDGCPFVLTGPSTLSIPTQHATRNTQHADHQATTQKRATND